MHFAEAALLREWCVLEVVWLDAEVGGDVVADHFEPAELFGGEAFDDVLAQLLGGPDAELRAAMGFDAVTDGDDDVEVVELDAAGYPAFSFLPNCQGFLDSSSTLQLVFIVNILDVKTDVLLRGLKQLGHLCLAQPDRIALKLYLQPCFAVLGLVEEDFTARLVFGIFLHEATPPTSRSI